MALRLLTPHMTSLDAAKITGLSWWEVRYTDGRVIREIDGVDWMDLGKRGLMDLRLIAPDCTYRGFANTADATGRLFQLKGGLLQAGMGGGGGGRSRTFHLIGLIQDVDTGRALCWSYEHDPEPAHWIGPFLDNFHAMRYQDIGALTPALLGN